VTPSRVADASGDVADGVAGGVVVPEEAVGLLVGDGVSVEVGVGDGDGESVGDGEPDGGPPPFALGGGGVQLPDCDGVGLAD
jgi:hypothetical protein